MSNTLEIKIGHCHTEVKFSDLWRCRLLWGVRDLERCAADIDVENALTEEYLLLAETTERALLAHSEIKFIRLRDARDFPMRPEELFLREKFQNYSLAIKTWL